GKIEQQEQKQAIAEHRAVDHGPRLAALDRLQRNFIGHLRYSSFGAFRLSPCALQSIKVDGLILSGRPRSHLPSTVANRRWLAQPLLDFAGHQGVAGRGEVIVADDVETLVPVPVGFARPEQCREQVDERLAMLLLAEPAPKRDLPAVAIALRDLLRPGIDDD